jgi:hypothetical protein
MSNNFKNTSLVTKLLLKEFNNALVLGSKVDRQLDSQFRKVGDYVDVRRPVMFSATSGASISSFSDIEEKTCRVQLTERQKVAFKITSQDLTLSVEDMTARYIRPAAMELAQKVESSIAGIYPKISNFVGTAGTTPSTFLNVGAASALMASIGVPMTERWCAFFDADASLSLANGLKAAFPQEIAKTAIEDAKIGRYAKFDMYECNSIVNHTVGIATGTPLVDGADQETTYALAGDSWSQTIDTNGWTNSQTAIVRAGDVLTFDGVYSVNRKTRQSTGKLQTFSVLANANSGGSTGPAVLTITPPMIISGPYQTVTAAPADDAVITVLTGTGGSTHPQNLAFHPNAITLAMANLDLPEDGASASRESYGGISIRAVRQYDVVEDETIFRFDILYGVVAQNPDFACRITG